MSQAPPTFDLCCEDRPGFQVLTGTGGGTSGVLPMTPLALGLPSTPALLSFSVSAFEIASLVQFTSSYYQPFPPIIRGVSAPCRNYSQAAEKIKSPTASVPQRQRLFRLGPFRSLFLVAQEQGASQRESRSHATCAGQGAGPHSGLPGEAPGGLWGEGAGLTMAVFADPGSPRGDTRRVGDGITS